MVSSRKSGKKQTQDVLDSHSSREEHKEEEEEEEEEDWITQLRLQLSDDDDEQPPAAKVSEQDVKSSRESKQEDTLDNTRVDKKVKSKDDKQKHCCTKRNNAVSVALTPNPKAFKRKIDTSEVEEGGEILIPEKHNKGCRCRKTGCTHPLCLCYRANKPCSETCRCQDCKNTGERNAIQHRQNKACKCQKSGCRHPPCICRRENRKCSEICKCKDCDNGREINNTIQRTQQATNEAIRSALGITKAIPASTTFTNKPHMSGIIKPKICSVMATKSMDAAAKKRSDKRQKHDKETPLDQPQRDANEFNDSSECVPGHADRVDKKPRSPATTNTSPSRQEPDDEEQTH